MSRKIKFRAWGIHCKHMLGHSDLIDVVDGGGSVIQMILDESIECHLMQYTGLKDRNGVEIYEGDILDDQENDAIWVVSFSDRGCFCAHAPDDALEWVLLDDYTFEVVGNIHENPDLLK